MPRASSAECLEIVSGGSKGGMKVGGLHSTILGLISHTPPSFIPPFEPFDRFGGDTLGKGLGLRMQVLRRKVRMWDSGLKV